MAGHGQDKGGFAKGKTFRERGITAVDDQGVRASEQRGVVHLTTVKRYVAVRFTGPPNNVNGEGKLAVVEIDLGGMH